MGNHHHSLNIPADSDAKQSFSKSKQIRRKKNSPSSNCNDRFIIKYKQNEKVSLLNIESLDQKRRVFVSIIGLYQTWKNIPSFVLYSSLFILPLKSEWIQSPGAFRDRCSGISESLFSDTAEVSGFLELLRWKQCQGLIFWLLDDYEPKVRHISDPLIDPFWYYLSEKLSSLYDPITGNTYNSLRLDRKWWQHKHEFVTKYAKTVSVLSELYFLPMKYSAIQEIIYQSNPNSLVPIKSYPSDHIHQTNLFDEGVHDESGWFMSPDYK